MGRIIEPPKRANYKFPNGESIIGTVIAQEMELEAGRAGEYMYVLQLIEWDNADPEIRIGYYYRSHGGGDNDWNWGRGAVNMRPATLNTLLERARNNPNFGNIL